MSQNEDVSLVYHLRVKVVLSQSTQEQMARYHLHYDQQFSFQQMVKLLTPPYQLILFQAII